jgi:hypothetical protein
MLFCSYLCLAALKTINNPQIFKELNFKEILQSEPMPEGKA